MNTAHQSEVQVSALQRHYGGARALDGVSLDIANGEVVAVLGPSGCGKSTLLRLVAGLDTPTGGEVRIGGELMARPGWIVAPEHRPVNMVFQDFALWPHMSVEQIIAYGMKYRGIARNRRAERIAELLQLLALDGMQKRFPRQLSGGQQQRVAIARALATEPRLLLFDEPLSNLDSQLRHQMRDELAGLLRRVGTTAMYVTHDLQEALTVGDRLVVMRDGQVEQIDAAEAIFDTPATPWVAGLVGYSNLMQGEVAEIVGDGIRVRIGDQAVHAPANGSALRSGDPVTIMTQPEAMRVLPASAQTDGENLLNGRVEQCHYEGMGYRVRVRTGAAALTVRSAAPFPPGDDTRVAFSPERTLLFPAA